VLKHQPCFYVVLSNVADPDHFNADPDPNPDTYFHYQPPQLQNFDSDAFTDLDQAFDFNAAIHSDADPDLALKK
jgi:hypothetical protein